MIPGYHLVLAANRDEFLQRPTAPLGYWQGGRALLAGRDLLAGGTWLGLNGSGKLGAVTNFRAPKMSSKTTSRGELVTEYLKGDSSATQYLEELAAKADNYTGFNLLLGDGDLLYYFSNASGQIHQLEPGNYGLSNGLLDQDWPKVTRGKRLFAEAINNGSFTRDDLFEVLMDNDQPADELLPDTGVGLSWERLLSTLFITSETYGTRSSSIIALEESGNIEFCERTFHHNQDGWQTTGEKCFTLG